MRDPSRLPSLGMITCPHYRGNGTMGKHDEVCKYIMQDETGKWCLCRHPAMLLCNEWVKAKGGKDMFEGMKRERTLF